MSLRLFAAVPAHSGMIVADAARTLLSAQELALQRGGSFQLFYMAGAVISTLRNGLVAKFLESDADLLLMLDSDQAIGRKALEGMIDLGQPLVGAVYPKRGYNWSRVNLGTANDIQQVIYQASEYVGYLEADANGMVTVTNGFARAEHLGTGLMLVRREVFERLMASYPDLEGKGFGSDLYPDLAHNWGFFNALTHEDGVPLSEDLSFCKRWRAAGGQIWADVSSPAVHVGMHAFEGNYFDYLKARAAADGANNSQS